MYQAPDSHAFVDQPVIYMIFAGPRYALRESLVKALRYAHEAMSRGETPTAIVNMGRYERLGPPAILEGWKELGLIGPGA